MQTNYIPFFYTFDCISISFLNLRTMLKNGYGVWPLERWEFWTACTTVELWVITRIQFSLFRCMCLFPYKFRYYESLSWFTPVIYVLCHFHGFLNLHPVQWIFFQQRAFKNWKSAHSCWRPMARQGLTKAKERTNMPFSDKVFQKKITLSKCLLHSFRNCLDS